MDNEPDWRLLMARMQGLEDERDIRATMQNYCHAVDHGDEAGYLDLFDPDARLQIFDTKTGEAGRPIVGHEWLARTIANHTRAPERWHQHHIANTVIAIDGDQARATSYFFLLLANDTPEVLAFGRYRDQMARGGDGRWRFLVREIHLDSAGKFSVSRKASTSSL